MYTPLARGAGKQVTLSLSLTRDSEHLNPFYTKGNLSPHPTSITNRPPQLGSAKLLALRVEASSRGVVAREERVEDGFALDRLEDVSRPTVN